MVRVTSPPTVTALERLRTDVTPPIEIEPVVVLRAVSFSSARVNSSGVDVGVIAVATVNSRRTRAPETGTFNESELAMEMRSSLKPPPTSTTLDARVHPSVAVPSVITAPAVATALSYLHEQIDAREGAVDRCVCDGNVDCVCGAR